MTELCSMFCAWLCRWFVILRAFKVLSVCRVVAVYLWREKKKYMQICIDKNQEWRFSFLLSFSPPQACAHPSFHPEKETASWLPVWSGNVPYLVLVFIFEILILLFLPLFPLVLLPVSHGYESVCVDFGFLPWRMLELVLVTSLFWNYLACTLTQL